MKKLCNEVGCGVIVEKGKRYCKKHTLLLKSMYNTKRWKNISQYKKNINPICEMCEEEGFVIRGELVHHIKDGEKFKNIFYNLDNLKTLCKSCHNIIHRNSIKNKNKKIEGCKTIIIDGKVVKI